MYAKNITLHVHASCEWYTRTSTVHVCVELNIKTNHLIDVTSIITNGIQYKYK